MNPTRPPLHKSSHTRLPCVPAIRHPGGSRTAEPAVPPVCEARWGHCSAPAHPASSIGASHAARLTGRMLIRPEAPFRPGKGIDLAHPCADGPDHVCANQATKFAAARSVHLNAPFLNVSSGCNLTLREGQCDNFHHFVMRNPVDPPALEGCSDPKKNLGQLGVNAKPPSDKKAAPALARSCAPAVVAQRSRVANPSGFNTDMRMIGA